MAIYELFLVSITIQCTELLYEQFYVCSGLVQSLYVTSQLVASTVCLHTLFSLTGLLRPLSVSLRSRTPQLCQLSGLIQPPILSNTAAFAVRAPLRATVYQAPRYNILQR